MFMGNLNSINMPKYLDSVAAGGLGNCVLQQSSILFYFYLTVLQRKVH